MNLKLILTVALWAMGVALFAQKPAIDNNTWKSWEKLQGYDISPNGKYAHYTYGCPDSGDTLTIVSIDGKFRKNIAGAAGPIFTKDSKRVIYSVSDGIEILELPNRSTTHINQAVGCKSPKTDNSIWLSYSLADTVILKNLLTGKERKFANAVNPEFNSQGSIFVLQQGNKLIWVDLLKNTDKIISHAASSSGVNFDKSGQKIVFINNYHNNLSLSFYRNGMDSVVQLAGAFPLAMDQTYRLAELPPSFTPNGNRIFFALAKKATSIPKDSLVLSPALNVWNYKDYYLQSNQRFAAFEQNDRRFMGVVGVDGNNLMLLENDTTKVQPQTGYNNDYIIIGNAINGMEDYWRKKSRYWVVSLEDGKCQFPVPLSHWIDAIFLSPTARYATWLNKIDRHNYCYDTKTQKLTDLTQEIMGKFPVDEHSKLDPYFFGVLEWTAGDEWIVFHDPYDVWLVSPGGEKKSFSITGGYGYKHKIALRTIVDHRYLQRVRVGGPVLMVGFEDSTKYNGFFKTFAKPNSSPVKLSLEPNLSYFLGAVVYPPPPPIKAAEKNIFLVSKQSGSLAPNVFVTTDFINFKQLSNIQPQKKYNWLSSEIVHWKLDSGKPGVGILYKPENFDPSKKYPIIFFYYERKSGECYQFPQPGPSLGDLNIAWYVSNGYLVFVPDIVKENGKVGESARDAVVSAANYLTSTYSWVNKEKMGLQGHSYGGYETNYIVTHSNLFAAAQGAAGSSNLISQYGSLGFLGHSEAFLFEDGQTQLGTTPWKNPDIYIANSPLFSVDKVTTPILLLHNPGDINVPFGQAIEFFLALRRLQKPVWLLEYDVNGHILDTSDPVSFDFTIRQQQFFDHYLKDKPSPLWMTEGIPYKYKGIKSGLQLDTIGKQQ